MADYSTYMSAKRNDLAKKKQINLRAKEEINLSTAKKTVEH